MKTVVLMYLEYNIYFDSGLIRRIEPYYYARHIRVHEAGQFESFNVFSTRFIMPRQTTLNFQTWLGNEIYEKQRVSRNTLRMELETQIRKQIYIQTDIRNGKIIYYDSQKPFQGYGNSVLLNLEFQITGNLNSNFGISYSDFYRDGTNEKIYDYTIYRNHTVFQFNRFLFFRSVLEYNAYREQLKADFLLSFTYIPGTVVYLGYGSLYEKRNSLVDEFSMNNEFLTT